MVKSLQGMKLWRDPRTGIYVYRRSDPITGRRTRQSTGTKILELAQRKVAEFEEERDRRKVGLESLDCWREKLLPLVGRWLAALEGELTADSAERTLRDKRKRIERTLEALDLRVAADLDRVGRIHDKLLALEKTAGKTRSHLRRCYQEPLKQFSRWLAENKRVLDRDPLATWSPLKVVKAPPPRRALMPDEVARALNALDALDRIHGRRNELRVVFTTLLITAPRASAFASRNVQDFDFAARRIRFGADVGKKRKGWGALDARTADEIAVYLGNRTEGPLFLSPDGARLPANDLRHWWREAVGYGLVEALWPAGEPRAPFVVHVTNQVLLTGRKPQASRGGNPELVRDDTREERSALEQTATRVAAAIGETWRERMDGVDAHGLRMTHRSWAEAKGVPPVLIDKQLGHSGPSSTSVDTLKMLAGSETGRKHYLDMRSALFDPARSAEGVRDFLDEAVARKGSLGVASRIPLVAHGA